MQFAAHLGDIVLLEPRVPQRPKPDQPPPPPEPPISLTVKLIDGTAFSHAVIVEEGPPDPWRVLSANEETGDLRSGVNSIALATLTANRGSQVLHPNMSDAERIDALHLATSLCEYRDDVPGGGNLPDTSDFAWDQLFLSGIAGVTRRMHPDSPGRGRLWRTLHGLSYALEEVVPWPRRRWDCCEFVVRVFEESGHSLHVVESDPEEHNAGAVMGDVLRAWWGYIDYVAGHPREFLEGLSPDDEAFADQIVDAASNVDSVGDLIGDVRRMVHEMKDIASRVGAAWNSIDQAPAPKPGDRVWPPFASPRLLIAACTPEGHFPPGVST